MTEQEQSQLVTLFGIRAEIAGLNFSPQALVMLVQDVSDLPFDEVAQAIGNWGRTETGFPYPAKLRAKVMPEIDPEDDAEDAANLIISAVAKFGHTNPVSAEHFVGELGWETVRRMGGWKHLCETMTHQNEGIYRAQIRDYAGTVYKRAKRGELDEKPALPSPTNEVKQLVQETMKGLE